MNDTRITIPETLEEHNRLVMFVADGGFSVPEPNEVTGMRVGHIYTKNPEPNHPRGRFQNNLLPVAYVGYGYLDLVNGEYAEIRAYHIHIRARATETHIPVIPQSARHNSF